MGYWSSHPMSGDAPLDFKDNLDYLLFSEEEIEQKVYFNLDVYKERLENRLKEAMKLDYTRKVTQYTFPQSEENGPGNRYLEDASFVLPFTVVECQLRILDPVISQTLKEMIKDGGARTRTYSIPEVGSPEYPTRENEYNQLESPFDYAIQLYENWEGLMNGSLSFDDFGVAPGLFDEMNKTLPSTGLLNRK